mgnify:CR=1 FL=1
MKVYRTDEIRNVVLLGHGGSGKTSLLKRCCMYQALRTEWGK